MRLQTENSFKLNDFQILAYDMQPVLEFMT